MYKLTFGDTPADKARYQIYHEALVTSDKQLPEELWETSVELQKKLESVGVPGSVANRIQFYILEKPTDLLLERSELNLLLTFVEKGRWVPRALPTVIDALKYLRGVPPEKKND